MKIFTMHKLKPGASMKDEWIAWWVEKSTLVNLYGEKI